RFAELSCLFSARKLRLYRERTSGQIRPLMEISDQTRRLKLNFSSFGHGQQVRDAFLATSYPLVFLGSEQHMRWTSPICDEDRPLLGRSLGPARVLIEFSTR